MKKQIQITCTALLAVFALSGCTPRPKKVCEHMNELSEEPSEEAVGLCRMVLTPAKMDKPDEYKDFAKCAVKAKSQDELDECPEIKLDLTEDAE